jgi:hypothetical protein
MLFENNSAPTLLVFILHSHEAITELVILPAKAAKPTKPTKPTIATMIIVNILGYCWCKLVIAD